MNVRRCQEKAQRKAKGIKFVAFLRRIPIRLTWSLRPGFFVIIFQQCIVMGKIRFGCKVRFWGGVMLGLCLG